MRFKSIGEIFCELSELVKPPERFSVSESAEKYRYVNQPGAYVGKWKNYTTPYMVEPMDLFGARTHRGLIFVGPAQSGKTDALVINTIAYSIKIDPMDVMLVCPTMTAARDFSIRRIDRLHMHSPDIGQMLLGNADSDNKFDKHYSNGMLLSLSWPTPTELAGKPIGRVILTDRDRMDDDIAGDGEPFDLAQKRTTTYGSYAMTVAESSPSREITDLKWVDPGNHEAPPCEGILKLYNRGDKRRWYWPCPSCDNYFEGRFTHLVYDVEVGETNYEKAEGVRLKCPFCSYHIHPDERFEMQLWGVWLKGGQGFDENGCVIGPTPRTKTASFWLNGIAAAFSSWQELVVTYLDATDDYNKTSSEEGLKKFYNNDLAEPYYPKSTLENVRLPETLKARAEKMPLERHVPEGVRFLIATVDIQNNRFEVSVFGILPGVRFDKVIIDRFNILKSERLDADGERLWVKPHTYLEDWDLLTEQVIEKEYPLADDSGRMMQIKFTGCDSGGKKGATTMAYDYYRKLRSLNKHRRFILTKGDHVPNMPRAVMSYPDASHKDKMSGARGDVPVLRLNSNLLKDDLDGRLDCLVPGKGMVIFPDWLSDSVYAELCSETRTPKGWVCAPGVRNEQWDLTYMCIGLCVSELIRVEVIDWANPPSWAKPWDENDLVRDAESAQKFANTIESEYNFADFGKSLA
jgi:phage terminase large subunit GpA-like protein